MKKSYISNQMFVAATLLLAMNACVNENAEDVLPDGKVPLELSVSGIETRAVIEGETLPSESQYGVFAIDAENGTNVAVNYMDGVSTLSTPVYLTEAGKDYQVLAYYPFTSGLDNPAEIPLVSIEMQQDAMYAQAVTVNQEEPQAQLTFNHALSRITLRITKEAENPDELRLSEVSLNNVWDYASLNLFTGEVSGQAGSAFVFQHFDNLLLGVEPVTTDLLVYPMNTAEHDVTLTLRTADGEDTPVPLPSTNWQSGQQYIYNVTITQARIEISEAIIEPWNNNEQAGSTVGDDNQAKARVGDIFYSDGTFSPDLLPGKTPIGVVFALTGVKDGPINQMMIESRHGRVVALSDVEAENVYWGPTVDVPGIFNCEGSGWAYVTFGPYGQPYRIDESYGNFSADLNGQQNTSYLNSAQFPAAYSCTTYTTAGREAGTWYLPSVGELMILGYLFKEDFIGHDIQSPFTDFESTSFYLSSSEYMGTYCYYLAGSDLYGSSAISIDYAAKDDSNSNAVRPVTTF